MTKLKKKIDESVLVLRKKTKFFDFLQFYILRTVSYKKIFFVKNDLCDRTRRYDWNLSWFLLLTLRFLIRHPGDKIEEGHLFEWIESVRRTKTSMIINHEHTSFPRHLYDLVFFFENMISHTWELIVFRIKIEELRSSTEEIFKWKLKMIHRRKKKSWIERTWNIEYRSAEEWHQFLVFQNWIESSWISNCNWLSDDRSNISSVLCCTIHAELNHSFFQLQMMMKMIMHIIVENGLIYFYGVAFRNALKSWRATRKPFVLYEKWSSLRKKKRVISTKSFRFILSILRRRFFYDDYT